MPICIAGMHRSGTSLVAHVLHVCGIDLGDEQDLVPASAANPDGYWEHRRFVEINEQLLAVLGGDWDTPAAVPEPTSVQWRRNADLAKVRKAAEELCAGFAGHGAWGWKDPRNSITLAFWSSLVPELKVVVCLRHPLEVAASLRRIDPNASIAAGVERWVTYYRRLLADAPASGRMLTHAGSYFADPVAEIRRIAGFAGLTPSPEALDRCVAIVRPDLRRNQFTADEVAGFDLPAQVLDLYERMCEEARWDETRARALTLGRAPGGAVAVEEYERLYAARATHTRQLAECARRFDETEAMFVKQQEEFLRQIDRRDDDLLWAMQTGITVRGVIRDYRRLVEYRRMVRLVRRVVPTVVPPGKRMLVISRGDEDLLCGPDAQYFPQGPGGEYPGYHPASSLAAIAHLEVLRARGADFLVVPTTELWWLDEYREFGRHVRNCYRMVLEDPWSCTIFALSESGAGSKNTIDQFREAMAECEQMLQREPAILDWGTGWRLESAFPDRTVFAPPVDDHVLPYVDHSVDVIALPGGLPDRIAEAERVASAAVITFPTSEETSQPLTVRWTTGSTGQLPSVSLIIRVSEAERDSSPMFRALQETLPERLRADLLAGEDVGAAAARATGEILVFLEPGAVVLPDWLAPLLRLFRDRPRAGAAGGRVLGPDGRLEHGGGAISTGGTLRNTGAEEYEAGGPASDVVRQIDWCSPVLLATRRALFTELQGFDGGFPSPWYAVADYCLRLREQGHDVLFQPDSSVARVDETPTIIEPPAAFVARWSSGEPVR